MCHIFSICSLLPQGALTQGYLELLRLRGVTKMQVPGPGAVAQPLRMLSAFPEGLSLGPSTQGSDVIFSSSTHVADTHSHEEKYKTF